MWIQLHHHVVCMVQFMSLDPSGLKAELHHSVLGMYGLAGDMCTLTAFMSPVVSTESDSVIIQNVRDS